MKMAKNKVEAISAPMAEKDWQADDDARTLMRAEEVKADPKRFAAATKRAQIASEEKAAEAKAAKKIAGWRKKV